MARKSKWYDNTAQILEALDTYARNTGAEGIRATVNEERSREVNIRDGAFEEGKSEADSRLSLEVHLSGGRHSSFSMDYDPRRFDTDLAKNFIANRVKSAELHPEDPNAGLAAPDQILQDAIHDESAFKTGNLLKPEDMIERAIATEKAALQKVDKGIDSSQGATMDTTISRSMLYISNGFLGVTSRKGYGIMLVAKGSYEDESGRTQYTLGSDAMNAVEYAELKAPQTLADRVVHEATRMRHARALTAEDRCNDVSLVFEPSLAPVFWGDVISAMQGKAVADGMSFLQDHFGEAVLPSDISVVNDPTIKGTLYHRYFDKDGLPASRHVMVDNGVIRNWFLDLYNARKLGMSPTGEIDNVLIESSGDAAQDLNALIRDIDTGIVVTDFNGGGMDTVMGQYQAGAKGILIRRGEMVEPVRDFSLAHNDLHAMLATTRIAGDHERKGRFRVPSTRVDGLTLSA